MKVVFSDEVFDCTKAVRKNSTATLFLSDGTTVTFGGVHNWDAFSLEGGSWGLPDVSPDEQLRADVDFLAIMAGVSL